MFNGTMLLLPAVSTTKGCVCTPENKAGPRTSNEQSRLLQEVHTIIQSSPDPRAYVAVENNLTSEPLKLGQYRILQVIIVGKGHRVDWPFLWAVTNNTKGCIGSI